jgi:uncharacterized glyoxalase superfamily protein PhnB
MSSLAKDTRTTVTPTIRYDDEKAAMEWLCTVFGFEKQLVVPNDDGSIAHAQLTFGNGMIMLGTMGGETHNICVVVSDADAVYARVKAAGVEILREIRDEHYGGRGFTCRDIEGHVWNFGTYDPWDVKNLLNED